MRTNLTRLLVSGGVGVAALVLWASPAAAHDGSRGDWRDRQSTWEHDGSWGGDPSGDRGGCDHGDRAGTSTKKAAPTAPTATSDTSPPDTPNEAESVEVAAPVARLAPEAPREAMHAYTPDAVDVAYTRAAPGTTTPPFFPTALGLVLMAGAIRAALVRR